MVVNIHLDELPLTFYFILFFKKTKRRINKDNKIPRADCIWANYPCCSTTHKNHDNMHFESSYD